MNNNITTVLKRKKVVITVAIILLLVATFKITIFDNQELLCVVAEGFNEPSIPFYYSLNRIYQISEKKNISNKFISYLRENKNNNLHELYIRILGVIGEDQAIHEFKKLYVKYQRKKNYKATIYYIVKSMGIIGNEGIVPFLEKILYKYNELDVQVPGSVIASALYLVTGKIDYYLNFARELIKK